MTTKLHRKFPSRERFVADFLQDLSEREMAVVLAEDEVFATGEMVDLDLRLDNGTPLVVGTGMVVRGGEEEPEDWCRIRFLGLSEGSRTALDGLVAREPSGQEEGGLDDPESLEALVAGAFGDRRRASAEATSAAPEEDSVLVPPASIPERPEPREPASQPEPEAQVSDVEAPGAEEPTRRKRSIWERLQVSPAVIVASLLAGVTGAAADYWFEELASFIAELRSADTAIETAPVIDIPPAGVTPSDFATTEPPPAAVDTVPEPSPPPDAGPSTPTAPGPPSGEPGIEAPGAARGEAAAASESEAAPADRIRLITWDDEPTGTVVTFWGNGPFLQDRVGRHRVQGGAPRELVKIRGIDLPYRMTAIDVGTEELARIRTGFHPQDRVNELHVVLDLTGPGIELTRAEASENRLSLHLEAVGPGEGPPGSRPTPAAGGPGAPRG